jgi:hypothetical protein
VGRLKDEASGACEALVESVRLFMPDTVLGWRYALLHCKWTFKHGRKPGRLPIDSELEGGAYTSYAQFRASV